MNVRKNAETVGIFNVVFNIILIRSEEMNIVINIPKLAKRQKFHCNILVLETPEYYYR